MGFRQDLPTPIVKTADTAVPIQLQFQFRWNTEIGEVELSRIEGVVHVARTEDLKEGEKVVGKVLTDGRDVVFTLDREQILTFSATDIDSLEGVLLKVIKKGAARSGLTF